MGFSRSRMVRFGLLGGCGFVAGLAAVVWNIREPGEPLTTSSLANARRVWQLHRPTAYEWAYRLHGDEYDVRVEGGIVLEVTVNGVAPNVTDLSQYTVEGMFDLLDLELENLSDPNGPFGSLAQSVITRVRYHADLGYVEHYVRSAGGMGRGASIHSISFAEIGGGH